MGHNNQTGESDWVVVLVGILVTIGMLGLLIGAGFFWKKRRDARLQEELNAQTRPLVGQTSETDL